MPRNAARVRIWLVQVRKGKIRRSDRREQPSLNELGKCSDSSTGLPRARLRRDVRAGKIGLQLLKVRFERLDARWLGTFFHPHPVVERKVMEFLHQPARPAYRRSHRALRLSQSEEYFLAVLGKKSRSGLKHAGLPTRAGFHRDRRADGVPITLAAAQTESDRRSQGLSSRSAKALTAGHCGFSGTLPGGHRDRSRRVQTLCRPRQNPGPPRPKRRKMFHRDCSRRRRSVRIRSMCRPSG